MKKAIIFLFTICVNLVPQSLLSQDCNASEEVVAMADSVFKVSGDLDSVLSTLKITLNDCLGTKDSLDGSLSELYHRIGRIYFDQANDREALRYLNAAAITRDKHFGPYHEKTSQSYYMLALSNFYLENHNTAIEYGEKAVEALEQASSHAKDSIIAEYYQHLSKCYNRVGDYSQALFYTQASLNSFPNKSDNSNYHYYHSIGQIYFNQHKHQLAIDNYQRAKQYLEKIGVEKEPSAYGTLMNDLGLAYHKLEKTTQASTYYQEALKYYKVTNLNTMEVANTYANLVAVSMKLNQFSQVNNYFNKGLIFAKAQTPSGFHPIIAELHYNKAAADSKQKKYESATYHLQKGIKALIPTYQVQAIPARFSIDEEPIAHKIELLELLEVQANTFHDKYQNENQLEDLKFAYATYSKIDTLVTQIRRGFKVADSKYFLQEVIFPIYEKAIATSFQLYELNKEQHYLEDAYHYIAKNKAVILLEGLQDENAKFLGIPDSLLQKEKRVKEILSKSENEVYTAQEMRNDSLVPIATNRLVSLKRQYEQLIQQFETHYPAYYQLKYAYESPLSIQEIQEKIEPDRALVEFFLGEENLFVFTISKNEFRHYKKKIPLGFRDLVYEYRGMLQEDSLLIKQSYSIVSHQLYSFLLKEPLQNLDTSINRLILIPDNILLQISFDGLLTQPHAIKEWYNIANPYLFKKYATALSYSNLLAFDNEKEQRLAKATKGFLGFGLEYDSLSLKDLFINRTEIDPNKKNRISGRLRYSDDEAREIGVLLNGDTFLNQAATKQALLKHIPNYNIVHIAGHGNVDEDNPLNSGIILSKSTDSTDNVLRASDIFPIKLAANMVVLSACQTGYGPLIKGEGMRTFAQAFASAGCPALIASLWNIPDASTKRILLPFYKNLKQGQPKDIALRNAKLHYLKNGDVLALDPSHWAHLVLIGNIDSIDFPSTNWCWWKILPLGLILFFFGIRALKQYLS